TPPEPSSPLDATSGPRRPGATMMRTSSPFAYPCCCPRGDSHDAHACRPPRGVGPADGLRPPLVDIGDGAVRPARTVDDSHDLAVLSRAQSLAAHERCADLAR